MKPANLTTIEQQARKALEAAASPEDVESIRVFFLGKKGKLTAVLRSLGELSVEERRALGAAANRLRTELEDAVKETLKRLTHAQYDELKEKEEVDVTLPGLQAARGHLHVISRTMEEMTAIFARLGFSVATGPEAETDFYNFQALNIPKDHPARDTQDTFYLEHDDLLLRTHTSPVQIRVMEKTKPPIRVIAPGRVYRRDSDPTHTPMFHQIEGLLVDETTSFAELKGTLTYFIQELLGKSVKLRFRPHHFPFTEPSAEVDISCTICGGSGELEGVLCRVCKGTKWLEVLGAGMVHPSVLRAGKIDPGRYRGFAFGTGIDRLAMLKYGIPDLRLLFENDLRFLEQF